SSRRGRDAPPPLPNPGSGRGRPFHTAPRPGRGRGKTGGTAGLGGGGPSAPPFHPGGRPTPAPRPGWGNCGRTAGGGVRGLFGRAMTRPAAGHRHLAPSPRASQVLVAGQAFPVRSVRGAPLAFPASSGAALSP